MSFKNTAVAALAAVSFAFPAMAGEMMIKDGYARAAGKMANAGAAFIVIENMTGEDDRLVSAGSQASKRVELHTHKEDANGVMRMLHVEEGFPVKAGDSIVMKRGGEHVMFMGLNAPMEQGQMIPVTLEFEKAGKIVVVVPVDLERKPSHGMKQGGHGDNMKHGESHEGHEHKHGSDG